MTRLEFDRHFAVKQEQTDQFYRGEALRIINDRVFSIAAALDSGDPDTERQIKNAFTREFNAYTALD